MTLTEAENEQSGDLSVAGEGVGKMGSYYLIHVVSVMPDAYILEICCSTQHLCLTILYCALDILSR